MSDNSSPEKSPWGWKAVIIVCILGALFLGFFFLAVNSDPDYMPSQQHKAHDMHQMAETSASSPSAAEMGMTQEEHANMANMNHEASASHGH